MVRYNVQLETTVNTITHEYLLEFTSEYGISEALRPELPGPGDRIVDFPEGKTSVYSPLLWSGRPTLLKTGYRRVAPIVLMLDGSIRLDSCSQSNKEKSPLDFADEAEASGRETAATEMPPPEEVPLATVLGSGQAVEAVVAEPPTVRECRKRGPEGVDANAPPKSLRRDHTDRPSGRSRGGKSLAAMQLCLDSNVFMSEGWMSFSKRPGKNTPQFYTKPLDSLKNWNNHFFWVDECVFPTAVEWRTNASKDGMPASGTYSVEAVRVLDTHRTPIQKQPEALL
nr:transposase (putative), gypsy type [Tanacetum cinerariifolium]